MYIKECPYMRMANEYIAICNDLERRLIEALKGEQDAQEFYKRLLTMAKDSEDKNIISKIYGDEGEHFNNFSKLYKQITGRNPMLPPPQKPNIHDYLTGIRKAIMDETDTYAFYKDTFMCTNNAAAKEIFLDAFTDENEHAIRFNYLFTKNK